MFSKKPKQSTSLEKRVRRAKRRYVTGVITGSAVTTAIGIIVVNGITGAVMDRIKEGE